MVRYKTRMPNTNSEDGISVKKRQIGMTGFQQYPRCDRNKFIILCDTNFLSAKHNRHQRNNGIKENFRNQIQPTTSNGRIGAIA